MINMLSINIKKDDFQNAVSNWQADEHKTSAYHDQTLKSVFTPVRLIWGWFHFDLEVTRHRLPSLLIDKGYFLR